jgi:hypothetical protein
MVSIATAAGGFCLGAAFGLWLAQFVLRQDRLDREDR